MNHSLVRIAVRRSRTLLALAVTAALAACGSDEVGAAKLKGVKPGTSRAELLSIMGTGPLTAQNADTMRVVNGFRRSAYFTKGALYEVIYFREEPGYVESPLVKEVETPVIVRGDSVLGWGWEYYAQAIKEFGIPNPLSPVKAPEPTPSAPAPQPAAADSGAPATPADTAKVPGGKA